ncbi:hypothetical protein EYF80_056883 [Liparis tanakae]|uniref:Uncharacterized protein n=1 Tax=Liparis tanakae TaxID=230148 RepID=A0A4Z2EXH2_9TELE|nr:hypothetical protein EYF80_056883 [Liparis tanakae]
MERYPVVPLVFQAENVTHGVHGRLLLDVRLRAPSHRGTRESRCNRRAALTISGRTRVRDSGPIGVRTHFLRGGGGADGAVVGIGRELGPVGAGWGNGAPAK